MKLDIKEVANRSKKFNLLYVEDDELARTQTKMIFDRFFDNITTAKDGQEGLDIFLANKEEDESKQFDLIFSDINMPKLSGLEMLDKIREVDSDIIFVILTAYNDTEHLVQAIELNVTFFIFKPIKIDKITNTINEAMNRLELQLEAKQYRADLEADIVKKTNEIEYRLFHDESTGLFNKLPFQMDTRHQEMPVVMLITINQLQTICEVYGDYAELTILEKFAKFLLGYIENTTYKVYTISKNEFAISDFVTDLDFYKYEEFVKELLNAIKTTPIKLDDKTNLCIEATIGISIAQDSPLETASIALKYAQDNLLQYIAYSKAIDQNQSAGEILSWNNKIKDAIIANDVVAVFQPIVNNNEEIVKYETLMRLKDSENDKLISPYFFLNIAEKTRLYEDLSEKIIFTALNLLVEKPDISLSINFSYRDIKNRELVDKIKQMFKENPQIGERTIFEIVESESIKSYEVITNFLTYFRKYGVKIAIDDFGTGFSNFENILAIKPDYLKIDGSLIKNIDTDPIHLTLVEAIVAFSHKLDIKVIAEFVHSEVIFEMLKKLNVDEYQGFYFYEPLEKTIDK